MRHCMMFFVLMFCATVVAQTTSVVTQTQAWTVLLQWRESRAFTFGNFPETFRSVPRHSDDRYLEGSSYANEPLPDAVLKMHKPIGIDCTIAYKFVPFTFGMVFSLHGNPGAHPDSDQRYQQNQWGNDHRIEGAALRYYQPIAHQFSQFGFVGGMSSSWLRLTQSTSLRMSATYTQDLTGLALQVEGGWDRYNRDQSWKKQTFARLYEHSVAFALEVGVSLYKQTQTKKIEQAIAFVYLAYRSVARDLELSKSDMFVAWKEAPIPLSFGIGVSF